MRILHVITMLDVGGAERLIADLLPRLREKGHQVDLLLFNGVDTSLKDNIAQLGISVFELSHGKDVSRYFWDVYNPWHIVRLRRYIRSYDIIHTHNTACQLFVPISKWLFGGKACLITTEHNSTNRRRSMRWYKPIDKWVYKQYSSIICIADQTKINLENYIGTDRRIKTIFNGVDISRFVKPIKNIATQSSFVVTMVAAFRAQKDQDTLVNAMLYLPQNYNLQFVGTGERENQVKAMSKALSLDNRITFLGLRTDVPDILEQSDILVLSSHWEGLSLSSIEGMASGRPFIASDVDGLREMVGGAGILFPHGDSKALAQNIHYLCEHPDEYCAVAKLCQEKAKQFDISIMADNYNKLYKSIKQER